MINLLSPSEKKQIRAAYSNTILARYIVLTFFVMLIIVAEVAGSYFILSINQTSSRATIADNEASSQKYSSAKQAVTTYKSNLSIAKYILNSRVSYTNILDAISKILPASAHISSITIDPTTFGSTPSQIIMTVGSYNEAISIKNQLQNCAMNGVNVFDSVSIANIQQSSGTSSYQVTYSATFSKKVIQ